MRSILVLSPERHWRVTCLLEGPARLRWSASIVESSDKAHLRRQAYPAPWRGQACFPDSVVVVRDALGIGGMVRFGCALAASWIPQRVRGRA